MQRTEEIPIGGEVCVLHPKRKGAHGRMLSNCPDDMNVICESFVAITPTARVGSCYYLRSYYAYLLCYKNRVVGRVSPEGKVAMFAARPPHTLVEPLKDGALLKLTEMDIATLGIETPPGFTIRAEGGATIVGEINGAAFVHFGKYVVESQEEKRTVNFGKGHLSVT